MQIARWGNSLAVRIPAKTVKALSLKEGDQVEVEVTVVADAQADSEWRRAQAIEKLRGLRGSLMLDDLNYDREDLYRR